MSKIVILAAAIATFGFYSGATSPASASLSIKSAQFDIFIAKHIKCKKRGYIYDDDLKKCILKPRGSY